MLLPARWLNHQRREGPLFFFALRFLRYSPLKFPFACTAALLLSIVCDSQTHAQQPLTRRTSSGVPPIVEAVEAAQGAPEIDGFLDEEVWQSATPVTEFTQIRPHDGTIPTERTEVSIVYDREAIYIGVRMFDSDSNGVVGRLSRRDTFTPSDGFWVDIDSHHDHRTGFQLGVNPSGVRWDGATSNDNGNADLSWDPVWSVATRVDSLGWVAEMKIPFSQLRFSADEVQTWGINFSRDIFRKDERVRWSWRPNDETGYASRFGHLQGLRNIPQPRRLELLPYSVARSTYDQSADPANPFDDGSVYDLSGGLDLKYGLTSDLTAVATINPDFGQVEADPAVVNLTVFETFFQERRPFFVEGADIFSFGTGSDDSEFGAPQLFYSRRVGRPPARTASEPGGYADNPTATRILGATKLSGQTGGWSIGLLDAVTSDESARVLRADGSSTTRPVEPLTNYGVLSLRKDLRGGASVIGIMGTATNRDIDAPELNFLRSAAYSSGLSFYHRFSGDQFAVSGTFSGSLIRGDSTTIILAQQSSARYYQRPDQDYATLDSSATTMAGYAGSFHAGRVAGNWIYGTDFAITSPGFEINDAGYQREADRIVHQLRVRRLWRDPGPVFRQANLFTSFSQTWNFGGSIQNRAAYTGVYAQFLNYWSFGTGISYGFKKMNDKATRGGPLMEQPAILAINGSFGSDFRRPVAFNTFGWFARNDAGGRGVNIGTSLTVRPTGAATFSLTPSFGRTHAKGFYVTRQADVTATSTHGFRYVFNELVQTNVDATVRMDLALSPDLSIQLYAQPFVASADYQDFKEWSEAGTFDFILYGLDGNSTLVYDGATSHYVVDADGQGSATEIAFDNPDFRVRSLRSNLVIRWEYSPGSTLFLVWNRGQSGYDSDPTFNAFDELGTLLGDNQRNTFVVKLNYWISL
jgi:hypothetical protein